MRIGTAAWCGPATRLGLRLFAAATRAGPRVVAGVARAEGPDVPDVPQAVAPSAKSRHAVGSNRRTAPTITPATEPAAAIRTSPQLFESCKAASRRRATRLRSARVMLRRTVTMLLVAGAFAAPAEAAEKVQLMPGVTY